MKRFFRVFGIVCLWVLLCSIPVQAKTTVKLNKTSAALYVNSSVQLKVTVKGTKEKVKWSSSNKKVASVSGNGKVTAKKAGTAAITANVNGIRKKCKITVKKNVTDLSKVTNKKLEAAAEALGFRHVKKADVSSIVYTGLSSYKRSTRKTYTANGSVSSGRSRITGESCYQNQAGKWNADIYDKKIAVFGAKVGMTGSKADLCLKKHGWNQWYNGWKSSGKSARMYSKNGAIINMTFWNGKVTCITYQYRLESEY